MPPGGNCAVYEHWRHPADVQETRIKPTPGLGNCAANGYYLARAPLCPATRPEPRREGVEAMVLPPRSISPPWEIDAGEKTSLPREMFCRLLAGCTRAPVEQPGRCCLLFVASLFFFFRFALTRSCHETPCAMLCAVPAGPASAKPPHCSQMCVARRRA